MTQFLDKIRIIRSGGIVSQVHALDRNGEVLCSLPCTAVSIHWKANQPAEATLSIHSSRVLIEDPS